MTSCLVRRRVAATVQRLRFEAKYRSVMTVGCLLSYQQLATAPSFVSPFSGRWQTHLGSLTIRRDSPRASNHRGSHGNICTYRPLLLTNAVVCCLGCFSLSLSPSLWLLPIECLRQVCISHHRLVSRSLLLTTVLSFPKNSLLVFHRSIWPLPSSINNGVPHIDSHEKGI